MLNDRMLHHLVVTWTILVLSTSSVRSTFEFDVVDYNGESMHAVTNDAHEKENLTSGYVEIAENICDFPDCICTAPIHQSWLTVNCSFEANQTVRISKGAFKRNVQEIHVNGGEEVRFQSEAFVTTRELQMVRATSVERLILKKHSFVNLTTHRLFLEVFECSTVVIETLAFSGIKGPLSANLTRNDYIVLQRQAFGYLADITIAVVPRLELQPDTFKFDSPLVNNHGFVATIHFKEVIIADLPRHTFSASAAEVEIRDSEVRVVHKEAFYANTIYAIRLINTSFHHIKEHALSEKNYVPHLELRHCRIRQMDREAFSPGVSNLSIVNSRISNMQTGAIHTTAVSILIANCTFDHVHENAISLKKWNRLLIERNFFIKMHNNSFNLLEELPYDNDEIEFSFTSNTLKDASPSSLAFLVNIINDANINSVVERNYFFNECQCEIDKWLNDIYKQFNLRTLLDYNFCSVNNNVLARCFNVNIGWISMKEFDRLVCARSDVINCENVTERTNIVEIISKEAFMRETTHRPRPLNRYNTNYNYVVLAVFIFISLTLTLFLTWFLIRSRAVWLKQANMCLRSQCFQLSSNEDEETTTTEDIGLAYSNGNNNDGKVPNELSLDLLQTLREKLANPDTSKEATDMIEALYERFVRDDEFNILNEEQKHDDQAHLYEELSSIQNRVPPTASLSELDNINELLDHAGQTDPLNRHFSFLRVIEDRLNTMPPHDKDVICKLMGDYAEPLDAEPPVDDSGPHVYTELPNNVINSSKCRLLSRPLPSKPINGRLYGEGTSRDDL